MTKQQQAEKDEAIARLKEWLKPGDTVYTILDHVSSSGMTRHIRVVLLQPGDDGKIIDLHPNWAVSKALGYRQAKQDGLIIGGCGMDMGFNIVYNLSRVLFGDGYALNHRWL